jgi:hypothetical protein
MKIKNVCDVCKNKRRKVKIYRVGFDGETVGVELCSEHAAPLEQMLKIGERLNTTTPKVKVWSLEDIEAEKRRQKRKQPPA